MVTQLITRTLPVSYTYEVRQQLDLKECPRCHAKYPTVVDDQVICGLCGHSFKFNKSQKSQMEYASALYFAGSQEAQQEMFDEARPLFAQAEEIFLDALKKKKDADLVYCLAQMDYYRGKEHLIGHPEFAVEYFENFLKWMEQFGALRNYDPSSCFIVARTYYNVGDELSGSAPVAGYFQKSLQWLDKADTGKEDAFADFLFNFKQDSMMRLARALMDEKEPLHDEEKARKLYLELADILLIHRLEPEHQTLFSFREVFEPSCFARLGEGVKEYARALKESDQSENIPAMVRRALDLSRKTYHLFNNATAANLLLGVYGDAYEFFKEEKDYESARAILEERADLWKGSLFKDLSLHGRHSLLSKRLETNRLLAKLHHEKGEKELEERAYKSNLSILTRAKKSYEAAESLEEERQFTLLQARDELARYYLKEDRIDQALRVFKTMLTEYEQFMQTYPESFFLQQSPFFEDYLLIQKLIETLEGLDEATRQKKPVQSLLAKAKAMQEKLDQGQDFMEREETEETDFPIDPKEEADDYFLYDIEDE